MKLNWGTGIVIAIAGFIAFILYFVITMTTDKRFDFDLVVEDYYKKEIGFQDELDAQKNALSLPEKLRIEQSLEGVTLVFPESIASEIKNGSVYFYFVAKKALDFEKPIVLDNHRMLIPASQLVPGRWDVTVSWEDGTKNYLVKENITL